MKAKLPVTDLAMQDAIFYTNLTLLLLLGFLISFIVYVAYRTIQNENKRKQYTPTMKQGDNVYFPVASGSVSGEILEVNGDEVKIIVTWHKSRVYPKI